MKKMTPCVIHYTIQSKSRQKHFADKSEAARWVVDRLSDLDFKFKKVVGDTWEVYALDIVKSWTL